MASNVLQVFFEYARSENVGVPCPTMEAPIRRDGETFVDWIAVRASALILVCASRPLSVGTVRLASRTVLLSQDSLSSCSPSGLPGSRSRLGSMSVNSRVRIGWSSGSLFHRGFGYLTLHITQDLNQLSTQVQRLPYIDWKSVEGQITIPGYGGDGSRKTEPQNAQGRYHDMANFFLDVSFFSQVGA